MALWLNASAKGSTAQFVPNLVNKGKVFESCLEFDHMAVQAAPVMEQLLGEALGGDFLFNSFMAIIAHQNGYPQALHQDGNGVPFYFLRTPGAPMVVTMMYMLDDMSAANGGTLIVPGSHRVLAGTGQPVGPIPPPINVTAPAGTVMLFDGRCLHATGVNRTRTPRRVIINAAIRTFMRTQEAWHISLHPQVLLRASPRLRQRLGFIAHTIGTVEGHGLGASGRADDEFSSIATFRDAADRGEYIRVGELSPQSSDADLRAAFTYRTTASGRRAVAKAAKFQLITGNRLAAAKALSGGGSYARRGTGSNQLTTNSKL